MAALELEFMSSERRPTTIKSFKKKFTIPDPFEPPSSFVQQLYLMDSISSLIPENILYTLNKIVFGGSDGRLSASLIKKRG